MNCSCSENNLSDDQAMIDSDGSRDGFDNIKKDCLQNSNIYAINVIKQSNKQKDDGILRASNFFRDSSRTEDGSINTSMNEKGGFNKLFDTEADYIL